MTLPPDDYDRALVGLMALIVGLALGVTLGLGLAQLGGACP